MAGVTEITNKSNTILLVETIEFIGGECVWVLVHTIRPWCSTEVPKDEFVVVTLSTPHNYFSKEKILFEDELTVDTIICKYSGITKL